MAANMVTLPDDFELKLPSGERKMLLQMVVLRQQLLRLAMKGVNAKRASELVGVHHHTVLGIYKDPMFRKEVLGKVGGAFEDVDGAYVAQRKSLHERLAEKAETAFGVLVEMLEDKEGLPSLRAKVAMDLLDRNPETQQGHTITRISPALESEQLIQAAHIARQVDSKVTPIRKVPYGLKELA